MDQTTPQGKVIMRTGRNLLQRTRTGQSLAELALIMPLLLLMVLGVIDFGRLFGSYIALQNASREGARFASLYSTTVTIPEIKDRAIREASATGYPGLRPDQVEVDPPNQRDWRDGTAVTVRMIYPFQMLTTAIFSSSQITVTVQTTMVVVGGA